MPQKVRVHLFVSGLVQGVFFRSKTRARAEELGLFGWVRNLEDGRVEILAEGEKEKLEKLVEWAKKGPDSAKINGLDVEWQEYKGEFKDFEIRYD
ncbi:MAG: acylphosphatase [Candidatus Nealsonbacteria bacterium CG_4_9_14_3_um_filter_37_13]|uniref:Acylphosphatase n=2 Tax=Candidatus Nealsoniibacteriota TaxID=1817911 RepID=A0A2H0TJB3_9BACT|nr:MAG: acylphosphatase [Candidatus Nealsonbacteria bacterium CG10_big_fil_rev_8_21_14_0_10_37_25]PJA84628.1 MAG: acylphosphatase [Candidatus Nealsonbacteria bacterium CG_4_9_14_3_um_filter_37_13]